jgi:hypothetical protein
MTQMDWLRQKLALYIIRKFLAWKMNHPLDLTDEPFFGVDKRLLVFVALLSSISAKAVCGNLEALVFKARDNCTEAWGRS